MPLQCCVSVNSLACTRVMVEIYYQTIFIISLKTINNKRVKALRNVALCLMLPNCLWWMYDRLLSLKPDLDEANDLMICLSLYSLRQTFLSFFSAALKHSHGNFTFISIQRKFRNIHMHIIRYIERPFMFFRYLYEDLHRTF